MWAAANNVIRLLLVLKLVRGEHQFYFYEKVTLLGNKSTSKLPKIGI